MKIKRGSITHMIAALLSSISSVFAHSAPEKTEPPKMKLTKKSERPSSDASAKITSGLFTRIFSSPPPPNHGERYPWKKALLLRFFGSVKNRATTIQCRIGRARGTRIGLEAMAASTIRIARGGAITFR